MKEQFVTYEIALKLKELGFDKPCLAYYEVSNKIKNGYRLRYIEHEDHNPSKQPDNDDCLAPLWQQVIDWLRDRYKMIISENFDGFTVLTLFRCYGGKMTREQATLKAIELIKNDTKR